MSDANASEPVELVYKILRPSERAILEDFGRFAGSADDERDGFIHLSTREQLVGTLAKHFDGEADLTILALDVAAMGDALRWEESRGGALFPHLYGAVVPSMVRGELEPGELEKIDSRVLDGGTAHPCDSSPG